MLKETKLVAGANDHDYDIEIASRLMSAANDLKMAGVIIQGEVSFSMDGDAVEDLCTVTDPSIIEALQTYVLAHASWQTKERAERFRASYEGMKGTLMHAKGYTDYGDGEDE